MTAELAQRAHWHRSDAHQRSVATKPLELHAALALAANLVVVLLAGHIPFGAAGIVARYGSLGLSLLSISRCVLSQGLAPIGRALLLYVPYFMAGLLATLNSDHIVASANALTRWSLLTMLGIALGATYEQRTVVRLVSVILTVSFVMSAIAALAAPSVGLQEYGSETVWRGIYIGKNQLGWAAAIGVSWACAVSDEAWSRRLLLFAPATLCLVGARSMGAIVAAGCAVSYWAALRYLAAKPLSRGLTCVILVSVAGLALVALTAIEELILSAAGRDLTFTGRTEIWRAYLDVTMETWFVGRGPGVLSGTSPETLRVLNDVGFGDQKIHSPHSSYIAVLGDAGLLGLAAYLVVLGKQALYEPLARGTPLAHAVAAIGMLGLVGGIPETRDVFSDGPGTLLFPLLWAQYVVGRGRGFVPAS